MSTELTETEVAVLLTPCDCGHTINDHGELAGCWACGDVGNDPCDVSFEALLVARVAIIVEERVAHARVEAWDEAASFAVGWPASLAHELMASNPYRPSTEPQSTADDQTEAECQPNREASR